MKRLKKSICLLLMMLITFTSAATFLPEGTITVRAAANYSAQVNKATNVVTIFDGNGTPVHAFTCSVGSATPLGTFYTGDRYRWWELDGPVYGQYCTRITGHILFHSVWYYQQDQSTQSTHEFNQLGSWASHGCVRLTTADAKWIYDNCQSHMAVNIINGTADNDPLGKPEVIKVSESSATGWDPTDPDSRNPYNSAKPSIDLSKVARKIAYGKKWDSLKNAVITDSCGNDVTASAKVSTKLKTNKLKRYKVTYKITDALGRSAKKSIWIRVVDKSKATIEGLQKNLEVQYGTTANPLDGVTALTVANKNVTSSLKVYVQNPSGAKTQVSGGYTFDQLGTYKIIYKVKNPYSKKTTKKTIKWKVTDTAAPVFAGVTNGEERVVTLATNETTQTLEATVNFREGVSAALVSGTAVDYGISIYKEGAEAAVADASAGAYTFTEAGVYYVTYSASNPSNGQAVTSVVVKYIVQ